MQILENIPTTNELQMSSNNESTYAFMNRLVSVQDYLLKEMKSEEDIFIVQDYQKMIFRLDDCICFLAERSKDKSSNPFAH